LLQILQDNAKSRGTCITTLNLSGHGSYMGAGIGFSTDTPHFYDQMPADMAAAIGKTLCDDAVVIVHACGTAASDAQRQALANVLGRKICVCTSGSGRPFKCDGQWKCFEPQPGKPAGTPTPPSNPKDDKKKR
jgi:hypothetical protein